MGLYKGLSHIAFDCMDMKRSLDFYTNKMGFERIMHLGDDKNPWLIYLKVSHGNYIELFPTGDKINTSARHCYSHLCIEVNDIFETVKVLRSRGVDVEDPHMGEDRNYQAWLSDPDGNRIELMQLMPDCMQYENDPKLRVIDRIEGDNAVVEFADEFVNVKTSELPKNAKEGDVLVLVDGAYTVDKEATKKRKAAMRARLDRLKQKAEQKNG